MASSRERARPGPIVVDDPESRAVHPPMAGRAKAPGGEQTARVSGGGMTLQGVTMPIDRPTGAEAGRAPVRCDQLQVVSFNIWFDTTAKVERAQAVVDLVKAAQADVICLQEVTPQAMAAIRADPWVHSTCSIVDQADSAIHSSYGVAILSRLPITAAVGYAFSNTGMGRVFVRAQIDVGGGREVAVGTVHLESLNAPRQRAQQLRFCAAAMEAAMAPAKRPSSWMPKFLAAAASPPQANATIGGVICGDFNFDATRNFVAGKGPLENDVLKQLPVWRDVWAALRPAELGHTFDTTRNEMLAHHRPETMRYDRVLASGPGLAPAHVDLLGTDPVVARAPRDLYPYFVIYDAAMARRVAGLAPLERMQLAEEHGELYQRAPIYPSDHFGLAARFALAG